MLWQNKFILFIGLILFIFDLQSFRLFNKTNEELYIYFYSELEKKSYLLTLIPNNFIEINLSIKNPNFYLEVHSKNEFYETTWNYNQLMKMVKVISSYKKINSKKLTFAIIRSFERDEFLKEFKDLNFLIPDLHEICADYATRLEIVAEN